MVITWRWAGRAKLYCLAARDLIFLAISEERLKFVPQTHLVGCLVQQKQSFLNHRKKRWRNHKILRTNLRQKWISTVNVVHATSPRSESSVWLVRTSECFFLTNHKLPSLDYNTFLCLFKGLLKKVCPQVYRHLKKVNAEPMFYCTEWFLCAFTRTLPWDTLLRVWDVFLCEGVKVLFKTALVILIGCLGTAKSRRNCPGLYSIFTF